MDRRRRFVVIAPLVLFVSVAIPAEMHRLAVNGDELEFISAPERGYVVKLAERKDGVTALSNISTLDTKNATAVGGVDRHGVWIVENDGPNGRNKVSIQSLSVEGQVAYTAPLFSSNGATVAIIPEIVVRMRPGVEIKDVHTLFKTIGCTIRKRMESTIHEYLIEVRGQDAEAVFTAVEALNSRLEVEWACPNTAVRPQLSGHALRTDIAFGGQRQRNSMSAGVNSPGVFPDDEYFPLQWHLHNVGQSGGTPGADIRAPEAWEITTGDPNIVVAVIDTGVDTTHPDLVDNLVVGMDFWDGDESPDPAGEHWLNAHGTNCAGLIAAQGDNSIGVAGVTWNCAIMPVRKSWAAPDGQEAWVTMADHAEALRWSAAHGASVLNNSWGFGSVPEDPIIRSAIVDITKPGGIGRDGKGCVVLFAAMNDGSSLPWTARYPEAITVGATDHDDLRCSDSDFGPELDIMGPSAWQSTNQEFEQSNGTGALWTTDISGIMGCNQWHGIVGVVPNTLDYTLFTGTSGATSVVAGVVALILSVEPELTGEEVRHFLCRSAKDLGDPGWDQYYGWGRVDARAALDMVLAKRADLNDDWTVDLDDLVLLIESWEIEDVLADIAPATKRDGIVDDQDLELLMQYWQVEIPAMHTAVD